METVFNYLNEILVQHFLDKKICFTDIIDLNKLNLELTFSKNSNITNPKLEDIKKHLESKGIKVV